MARRAGPTWALGSQRIRRRRKVGRLRTFRDRSQKRDRPRTSPIRRRRRRSLVPPRPDNTPPAMLRTRPAKRTLGTSRREGSAPRRLPKRDSRAAWAAHGEAGGPRVVRAALPGAVGVAEAELSTPAVHAGGLGRAALRE